MQALHEVGVHLLAARVPLAERATKKNMYLKTNLYVLMLLFFVMFNWSLSI